MALCVMADAGAFDDLFVLCDCIFYFPSSLFLEWEWDASSPLLSGETKKFGLCGEGNSIATKVGKTREFNHTLVTRGVMESGKHRISFKVMKGAAANLWLMVGVVRDGTSWNELHAQHASMNGWLMCTAGGSLFGNREHFSDPAGKIKNGQIVSVELDSDAGTLKF